MGVEGTSGPSWGSPAKESKGRGDRYGGGGTSGADMSDCVREGAWDWESGHLDAPVCSAVGTGPAFTKSPLTQYCF